MDLGAFLLLLALAIFAVLFISRPFRQSEYGAGEADQGLSPLLAERDQILDALQELDFDYHLGKIPAQDYPGMRAALVQRGAEVLRRLDALQIDHTDADLDAEIEAMLEKRRKQRAGKRGARGR